MGMGKDQGLNVALRIGVTASAGVMLACAWVAPSVAYEDGWPTFRGADRTAVAPDKDLKQEWPEDGPKLLWTGKGAGRGYSSLAIADGKMYTLGDAPSTADDDEEYLSCFEMGSGNQLWSVKTGPAWTSGQESWQSSRSTPTVDGDRVYIITAQGDLICFSTAGEKVWSRDLKEEFGGQKADSWGYSESATIDGDKLICTPGGPENTMVALDKMTGEEIWTTSREDDRGAGHACVVISNVDGRKVYVQTTGSGPIGVDAETGELLWSYEIDKTTAVIPTPIVRDDLVFFAAGYGRGGALLRQVPTNSGVEVEEVYPLNSRLANKHGGIVLVGDYLYGDSDDRGTPFCAEFMTGEIKWTGRGSGKRSACVAAADGHLYFRYQDGTMTLVEANPDEFEEVSAFEVPGSGERPSWAHPVILDGKLFLREGDLIHCFSLTDG